MTQNDQETLNEIFLGKEDPDMAFKKPMTNNLKEIPDLYNYLEDRLLRYIGGGDSLFGEEIHNLLQGLENDIQALINQKEKELLDKLEEVVGRKEVHKDSVLGVEFEATKEVQGRNQLRSELRDRIKQLKEEGDS